MHVEELLNKIGNPLVAWLLRSPLHSLLQEMMLIRVTGRKSGRPYTTPVGYFRQGTLLQTFSFRKRTWWRNLRGGAPVVLWLGGQETPAWAEVVEDPEQVAEALRHYLHLRPTHARYFEVPLAGDGQPAAEAIIRAAQQRVVIQTKLEATMPNI